MVNVLVTGGAGFIGHHLVEHLLNKTDWNITILDRLNYAGNLGRIDEITRNITDKKRLKFVFHDLKAEITKYTIQELNKPKHIFHLAANSHVNRSIDHPLMFVKDNVVGTCNLLNYARTLDNLETLFHMSTDEVFGPATTEKLPPSDCGFGDLDRYNSGSPYAASKCGAEELCVAFHNTYGLPITIGHCSNVFGERQDPEKYIPFCVKQLLSNNIITIHGKVIKGGKNVFGNRHYVYAKNIADAIMYIGLYGTHGEKYNIPGQERLDNYEVAERIASVLGLKLSSKNVKIVDPYSDRPGGDFDYNINGDKLFYEIGYKFKHDFYSSFIDTVVFTQNNPKWLA